MDTGLPVDVILVLRGPAQPARPPPGPGGAPPRRGPQHEEE